MKVKEIKETIDIDLTEYEHQIIFLSSLMEGLRLTFNHLVEKSYSTGITRKELHGFNSLFECFLNQAKRFDERFYEDVINEAEIKLAKKLEKQKN